jgi:hypothetical protein
VNDVDRCVYYCYDEGEGVILCLYVDDILIFGTSLNVIKEVKEFLSNSFEMKDLGVADIILNIKLLRECSGWVTILQSYYVRGNASLLQCLMIDPSVLSRKKRILIARDQLRYSRIIGSVMYLASITRPGISSNMSKLCWAT